MAHRKLLSVTYDPVQGQLGPLKFTEEFQGEDPLLKADILQDLWGQVEVAYNTAREEMEAHFNKVRAQRQSQDPPQDPE